jgi:hypothetical protein
VGAGRGSGSDNGSGAGACGDPLTSFTPDDLMGVAGGGLQVSHLYRQRHVSQVGTS